MSRKKKNVFWETDSANGILRLTFNGLPRHVREAELQRLSDDQLRGRCRFEDAEVEEEGVGREVRGGGSH